MIDSNVPLSPLKQIILFFAILFLVNVIQQFIFNASDASHSKAKIQTEFLFCENGPKKINISRLNTKMFYLNIEVLFRFRHSIVISLRILLT